VKGVILAAGLGTRLLPLTQVINKQMLPIGQYPMIYYSIKKLADNGIQDILLIIGGQSVGMFMEYLGSGEKWNVRLTYKIQEQSSGIAHALSFAEGFVLPGEKFVVLLGDNLFADPLQPFMKYFEQKEGAMVLLKEVDDPSRYGVPLIEDDSIVAIVEKPDTPFSKYAVTGIYFYDSSVFDKIRTLHKSARGEMEITGVNNIYAKQGMLSFQQLTGWWIDAGTHESLAEAARMIREENS
jgi:glucose-1-phosphate thymidylyltransferase